MSTRNPNRKEEEVISREAMKKGSEGVGERQRLRQERERERNKRLPL
jgi:hypothetical protein